MKSKAVGIALFLVIVLGVLGYLFLDFPSGSEPKPNRMAEDSSSQSGHLEAESQVEGTEWSAHQPSEGVEPPSQAPTESESVRLAEESAYTEVPPILYNGQLLSSYAQLLFLEATRSSDGHDIYATIGEISCDGESCSITADVNSDTGPRGVSAMMRNMASQIESDNLAEDLTVIIEDFDRNDVGAMQAKFAIGPPVDDEVSP